MSIISPYVQALLRSHARRLLVLENELTKQDRLIEGILGAMNERNGLKSLDRLVKIKELLRLYDNGE